MKKIAFSLILVIVVTAIFSVNVFAADEYVITFNSVEEYPDILHVDSMEVAIEEDALKLTLTGERIPCSGSDSEQRTQNVKLPLTHPNTSI